MLGKMLRRCRSISGALLILACASCVLSSQVLTNGVGESTATTSDNERTHSALLISEALCTFPPESDFIEYDHVRVLRGLSSYESLSRKLDGDDLQQLEVALQKIGLDIRRVDDKVVGKSASSQLYGLLSGHLIPAARTRLRAPSLNAGYEGRIFCPGERLCLAVLSNSVAAFGELTQVRRMVEARKSSLYSRSTPNGQLAELLKNTDADASVRGAALNPELNGLVWPLFAGLFSSSSGIAGIKAGVSGIVYSATFDSTAHMEGMFACNSRTSALLLTNVVSAARVINGRNGQVRTPAGNIPVQTLKLASSGSVITFRFDMPISIDQ